MTALSGCLIHPPPCHTISSYLLLCPSSTLESTSKLCWYQNPPGYSHSSSAAAPPFRVAAGHPQLRHFLPNLPVPLREFLQGLPWSSLFSSPLFRPLHPPHRYLPPNSTSSPHRLRVSLIRSAARLWATPMPASAVSPPPAAACASGATARSPTSLPAPSPRALYLYGPTAVSRTLASAMRPLPHTAALPNKASLRSCRSDIVRTSS